MIFDRSKLMESQPCTNRAWGQKFIPNGGGASHRSTMGNNQKRWAGWTDARSIYKHLAAKVKTTMAKWLPYSLFADRQERVRSPFALCCSIHFVIVRWVFCAFARHMHGTHNVIQWLVFGRLRFIVQITRRIDSLDGALHQIISNYMRKIFNDVCTTNIYIFIYAVCCPSNL